MRRYSSIGLGIKPAPTPAILWSPEQLGLSLKAWYDASDTRTITSSVGAVSQLNDKSGNGYHVTQSTGANQPTTGTRTINGLNGLDFDGVNDVLADSHSVLTGNPDLIYITVCLVDNNSAIHRPTVIGNASASFGFVGMTYGSGGDVSRFNGGSESYQTSLISTAFIGCMVRTSGSNIDATVFRRNGTAQSSTASSSGTSLPNIIAGIGVGGYMSTATKIASMDGIFGESIIVQSSTAANYQLLEGYLAWKWGLQSSLDAGHPYKNFAPTIGMV